VKIGPALEIISCDNEEQFLSRVAPRPATIDINLELVGRRGVQQLLWRMRHPEARNRITVLVEPRLVEVASNGRNGNGFHGGSSNGV
jgi:DNA-binding LacI/PurR family transcriptional regulator